MGNENTLQTDEELGINPDEDLAGSGSEITDESESDLAPEAGENQSKNSGGEVNQEKINAAINKQHFKFREEERKRIAAEEENRKLREQLASQSSSNEIVIPEVPDPFDEDFEQKVKARDEAIRLKAEQDAKKKSEASQLEENEKAAVNAANAAFNAKAEAYKGRFAALGVTPDEMKEAGKVVASYLTSQDLVEFVIEHESGPLITKYLAANPLELHELSLMNPIQATMKLQSDIIPAAEMLKPKASNTPEPLDDVSGRGAGEKTSQFLKGATFE